jgi:hypothetical protein
MIILLGGLMVVVVLKVFAGGIAMSGLLTVKGGKDDASFSPGPWRSRFWSVMP